MLPALSHDPIECELSHFLIIVVASGVRQTYYLGPGSATYQLQHSQKVLVGSNGHSCGGASIQAGHKNSMRRHMSGAWHSKDWAMLGFIIIVTIFSVIIVAI